MIFGKRKKDNINIVQPQKEEYFDSERVSSYYHWKTSEPSFQNINDHTWADMDMDEIFMFLDRTHSRPGQQYLYYLLRSIPLANRANRIESIISSLHTEEKQTIKLVGALKNLNSRGSYFLHNLFSKEVLKKPGWFWMVYALFITTIGSLAFLTIYPPLILLLLACLVSNFIIHYWNKAKLMEFSNAISQLYRLDKACGQLSFLPDALAPKSKIQTAHQALKKLTRKSFLLRENSHAQNEFSVVADSIVEILKASLLIEPMMLFHLTAEIRKSKDDLKMIFEAVGFADACLSIHSIRENYSYSIPTFTNERVLKAIQCYHPLVVDPVPNSIDIPANSSVLISGSNMSGKTTFIRTLGINALLGQTINTIFADQLTLPKCRIFSAIRISDDLLNDESFYQKEVRVIHGMIKASQGDDMNLFLIDELYKGTNSIERIGAGASVLAYLQNDKSIVCASTHDLELTELLNETYTNYHFTEMVNQGSIKFDYKLHEGKLQNTNAIRILEESGYPLEITTQARKIVSELTKNRQ